MMRALTALMILSTTISLVPPSTLPPAAAQSPAPVETDALHRGFDELLDLNVRDGLVYYLAIKSERRRLDAYVASLDAPSIASALPGWSKEKQAAFWLNAYNAFVLQTVLNNYPIRGTAPQYPRGSIRQIPGAFERLTHRAAGRTVTLDQIEKTILPDFRDPRLYLALGRGAIGSGRLRSEAYIASKLESQLKLVAAEFAAKPEYIRIDRVANTVTINPIVGWHDAEFIAAYADAAAPIFSTRSPIERAILAFIEPNLLPTERDFLDKNEFKVSYHEFDWRLNDLTGGPK
jgi:hypothetical protein